MASATAVDDRPAKPVERISKDCERLRLGSFELSLLAIILHLGEKAHPAEIWREVKKTKANAYLSQVSDALASLVDKRCVEIWKTVPAPSGEGGPARSVYRLTSFGKHVRQEAEKAITSGRSRGWFRRAIEAFQPNPAEAKA